MPIRTLNMRGRRKLRALCESKIKRAITGMKLYRGELPIDLHVSIRASRIQRADRIMNVDVSVRSNNANISMKILERQCAIRRMHLNISRDITHREIPVRGSRVQLQTRRCLHSHLGSLGRFPVDLQAHMRLLFQREVDMVLVLMLFKTIERQLPATVNFDLDRLALAAGVDIQMAVAGLDGERSVSTE